MHQLGGVEITQVSGGLSLYATVRKLKVQQCRDPVHLQSSHQKPSPDPTNGKGHSKDSDMTERNKLTIAQLNLLGVTDAPSASTSNEKVSAQVQAVLQGCQSSFAAIAANAVLASMSPLVGMESRRLPCEYENYLSNPRSEI